MLLLIRKATRNGPAPSLPGPSPRPISTARKSHLSSHSQRCCFPPLLMLQLQGQKNDTLTTEPVTKGSRGKGDPEVADEEGRWLYVYSRRGPREGRRKDPEACCSRHGLLGPSDREVSCALPFAFVVSCGITHKRGEDRKFVESGEQVHNYRARNKGLYVVARNFFLLLLDWSAWPCLGPA